MKLFSFLRRVRAAQPAPTPFKPSFEMLEAREIPSVMYMSPMMLAGGGVPGASLSGGGVPGLSGGGVPGISGGGVPGICGGGIPGLCGGGVPG